MVKWPKEKLVARLRAKQKAAGGDDTPRKKVVTPPPAPQEDVVAQEVRAFRQRGSTGRGIGSDENAGVRTPARAERPEPRPAVSAPEPRPRAALGTGTDRTRAGLASDENAKVITSAGNRPEPRPEPIRPKPRAQTALGSGGTRAGLASDENAGSPKPKAVTQSTSGRRALAAGADLSFVRPIDAPGETRGQRQQRMARERSMAEGRRG
jgi:hypothetical protein